MGANHHARFQASRGAAASRRLRAHPDARDTAFSRTAFLDRWDDHCIEFVFGIQAGEKLCETADSLPGSAWTLFECKPQYEVKTSPRSRPRNVKNDIVMERECYNQHLCREDIAESDSQSKASLRPRMIAVIRSARSANSSRA